METKEAMEKSSKSILGPLQSDLLGQGLIETALRHKWLILSTSICFLMLAGLYLLKATPIFRSTARLYVEQSGPKIISDYEGVMTKSKNYLNTQCELIKSTPIVAAVANDDHARNFQTFKDVDNIVGYLKKNLDVTVGRKDDIMAISFDSPHSEEAANIVNSVVDSYVSYHTSRKRSTVSEVLRILQKEKVKRDKELSEKFQQMLDFTRNNGVVAFNETGGNVALQRLAKLSEALTEAQLTTINARADYETAKILADEPDRLRQFMLADADSARGFMPEAEQTQLNSQLKQLQLQLKDARYNFTEEHPLVKEIRGKIEDIRQRLSEYNDRCAETYIDVMEQRLATAKQRENELKLSFQKQHKVAQDLGVTAAEYSILQADLKRTERLCEILDNRIKELNVTEDAGALNICVLEVARPSPYPAKPQKARAMGVALLLGLIAGMGLAICRDWMDYTLRSSDEIAAILAEPILGVIPSMGEEQVLVAQSQKLWRKIRSLTVEALKMINVDLQSFVRTKAGSSSGESDATKRITFGSKIRKTGRDFREIWGQFSSVLREFLFFVKKGHTPSRSYTRRRTGQETAEEAEAFRKSVNTKGQTVLIEPWSVAAEAFRTVRTSVFFNVPKDKAKTIVITSPAPGDGKSTLVSNLGIAMAQAGQRTIIIDADFRKPMQHNIFRVNEERGLSHVFAGQIALNEAIRKGPVEGLDVLICGQEVQNPSEILNSDAFFEALTQLRKQYDRIIIDSPPVGAVADGQILGAICDVVLLVIKAEKSTKRLSLQAKTSLANVGANLLGIVVNDVPRRSGRYGYYSGYKYKGYYGYYGRRPAGERQKTESAEAPVTSKNQDDEQAKEKLMI